MKRTTIHFFLFFLIIANIGCEKETDTFSDNELLEIALSDYFYPDNFYHEDSVNAYYLTIRHITPNKEGENINIELSTNNINQARQWIDFVNNNYSPKRFVLNEKESDKYYEYERAIVGSNTNIFLNRIHKSDYFIPMCNKSKPFDTVGIYNGEINKTELKKLIEYLWSCRSLGIPHKVIDAHISDNSKSFKYYIKSLRSSFCDIGFGTENSIYIYSNNFTLDKLTRTLTMDRELIKEIKYNCHTKEIIH